MKILAHINEGADIATKKYVDDQNKFQILVVDELPDLSEASLISIYLVHPDGSPLEDNYFDEYICVEDTPGEASTRRWELIGSTEIDLSKYVKKTELEVRLADFIEKPAVTKTLADFIKDDQGQLDGTGVLVKDTTGVNKDITVRKLTLADFAQASTGDVDIVAANSDGKVTKKKLSDFITGNDEIVVKTENDTVETKKLSDFIIDDANGGTIVTKITEGSPSATTVETRRLSDFITGNDGLVVKENNEVKTRTLKLSDFAMASGETIDVGDTIAITKNDNDGNISVKKLTLSDFITTSPNMVMTVNGSNEIECRKITLTDFANQGSANVGKVLSINNDGDVVLEEVQICWTEY